VLMKLYADSAPPSADSAMPGPKVEEVD
jgi:hypothetical protein